MDYDRCEFCGRLYAVDHDPEPEPESGSRLGLMIFAAVVAVCALTFGLAYFGVAR